MDFLTSLLGGGIKSIDPAEAYARLQNKPAPLLLDVRQPEEYREVHVDGAKLIPLGELGREAKNLPKDAEILCICASCSRSIAATRQLTGMGFNVVNVRNGMGGWLRAGLPAKRGSK